MDRPLVLPQRKCVGSPLASHLVALTLISPKRPPGDQAGCNCRRATGPSLSLGARREPRQQAVQSVRGPRPNTIFSLFLYVLDQEPPSVSPCRLGSSTWVSLTFSTIGSRYERTFAIDWLAAVVLARGSVCVWTCMFSQIPRRWWLQ